MPLCGSDGITYLNKCEMEKKVCESNGQVINVYSGPCGKDFSTDRFCFMCWSNLNMGYNAINFNIKI